MRKQWNILLGLVLLTITFALSSSIAIAQGAGGEPVATVTIDSQGISWQPKVSNESFVLTITGPDNFQYEQVFTAGNTPSFDISDAVGDGPYTYELVAIPVIEPEIRQILDTVTEENRRAVEEQLKQAGKLPEPLVQSGYFLIGAGTIVTGDRDEVSPFADQQILDDLIVQSSICAGQDCVNGESFGFDTIRLKENNLRIKAQDTSNSASFPTVDWQLTFNDSSNGGMNKFSVDSIDNGATPFTIEYGASSHSLYVDDGGRIGIGTSTPIVETHVKDGDTPTLRLEQDGTSGFTPQTWDVAGNESGFFVRDATNGSKLSLRIRPNAPASSLDIAANGDIGLGDASPDGDLDLERNGDVTLYLTDTSNKAWVLKNQTSDGKLVFSENSSANSVTIDDSGNVVATGTICDSGGSNCIGSGGGNASQWTTSGSNIYYTAGNIGLGTSDIENWTFDAGVIESIDSAILFADNGGLHVMQNAYNESGWKYKTSGPATNFYQKAGSHIWLTAPSGTIDTAINWTTAMQLDNSGNLTLNGGLTQNNSDVNSKENFKPVDEKEILERLADLPITTWNYKTDDAATRHIGPMAQDFYAAFEVGMDERHIAPLDTNGVTMASIKALYQLAQEKEAQLVELQRENAELEARLDALEQLVEEALGQE